MTATKKQSTYSDINSNLETIEASLSHTMAGNAVDRPGAFDDIAERTKAGLDGYSACWVALGLYELGGKSAEPIARFGAFDLVADAAFLEGVINSYDDLVANGDLEHGVGLFPVNGTEREIR